MRSPRTLNALLTVNAVLLAAVLSLQLAGGAGFASPADAQVRTRYVDRTSGIPNAGAQRNEMIQRLRQIEAQVKATNALLDGGRLRVTVANVDAFKQD